METLNLNNSVMNSNKSKQNSYTTNSRYMNVANSSSRRGEMDADYGDIIPIDVEATLAGQGSNYYEEEANRMLGDLVIGVNDPVTNRENSRILQNAMDYLSEHGGGTLNLPAGEIYFGQGGCSGTNPDTGEKFAIICRSNVHLKGAGTNGSNATVLLPVFQAAPGETSSMDMFFFNHYSTSGFPKGADGKNFGEDYRADYTYTNTEGEQVVLKNDSYYLTNADYSDFVIDASNVHGNIGRTEDGRNYYTSAGKGFMINLFKDCDWKNVVVKNTDATGFGMDCPINCTIIDCVAIGCGKQAQPTDGGASGFGIGTGYANNESILITNCKAYNNKKYGIFFEHQSRFQLDTSRYPATTSNGFLVTNCESGGNLYDFGGIKAYDVTFRNIKSVTKEDQYAVNDLVYRGSGEVVAVPLAAMARTSSGMVGSNLRYDIDGDINSDYTAQHLYFSEYSTNCHVENSNLFSNVTDMGQYVPEITWAINTGSMKLKGITEFGSKDPLSRMDVMQILYRYMGMPNEVNLTDRNNIGQNTYNQIANASGDGKNFTDLQGYAKESDGLEAILWGVNNGVISKNGTFNPDGPCSRSQIVTMLYRMAGSPPVSGTNPFTDTQSNSWYSDALQWAYNTGIIKGTSATTFSPDSTLTKQEMAIMLARYSQSTQGGIYTSGTAVEV